MYEALHHPGSATRPLIGDVEASDPSRAGGNDRDEAIIRLLRDKLKGRPQPESSPEPSPMASKATAGDSDKYEPQRLGRKICWQYDNTARKVPLLRRHYI